MGKYKSDDFPEGRIAEFLFSHTFMFDLLIGIIVAIFVWTNPIYGAVAILCIAALTFLSVRCLRLISRSKANKLFSVLNEYFPRTSSVISDPYQKHFHFFVMTTMSQAISKLASGMALLCILSGGMSVFRWFQSGDILYLAPILATVILYLFASRASTQANYPLHWLMNMGEHVPAKEFLWREHVALATLVLVINGVCNLVGSEDGKRKLIAGQIVSIVSEKDRYVMWSSSSKLLSGYNQISTQIVGFNELFAELNLDNELDILVSDISDM